MKLEVGPRLPKNSRTDFRPKFSFSSEQNFLSAVIVPGKRLKDNCTRMQVYSETGTSKKAILFFAGWGMDEKPFTHMQHKDYDLIIFYDYTSLSFSGCPREEVCSPSCSKGCIMQRIFSHYREITIIGWGFGVWCASAAFDKYLTRLGHFCQFRELKFWAKIKRAIAINGTLMPISATWGISPQSLKKTIEALPDTSVMEKFIRRMCQGKKEYEFYIAHTPQRETEQAKKELLTIKENLFLSNSLTWDTAITSQEDTIFKTSRQQTFWHNYSNITGGYIPGTRKKFNLRMVEIPGSHYMFNRFGSWEEILSL